MNVEKTWKDIMKSRIAWKVLLLVFLVHQHANADEGLAKAIDGIINGPNYQQSRWGILIVDAQTGSTIYEHDPDRMFIPASTTKLYSCATALDAFGPDYRFETPVYRRGEVKNGRLYGDLILVASGDLTLGGRTDAGGKFAFTNHDHIYANGDTRAILTDTDPLAGLKDLARQIKAAGITRVSGDVLIDDRLFHRAAGSGSGPAAVSPIVVNDNGVDAIITPADKAGEPAIVRMRPETSFIHMDAQVKTVAKGSPVRLTIEEAGTNGFTIRGQIPVNSKPWTRIYPVRDPAGFARALFMDMLRQEGITLDASALRPPQGELPEQDGYAKLTRVAVFRSPPFSEAIKVTLKVSHNLYASTLPLLVASKNGKRTLPEGLHLQRKFLSDLGVQVETISFGGGAGGANADSVTPRATVKLLQAMAKRPDYSVFHDALPILGVDGTLHDSVPSDSPVRGKVHAKTGTLMWHDVMNDRLILRSKALAGTLTTAGGRELFVAMFVNDVPLPKGVQTTREGKVLGKLCEIIYLNVPNEKAGR
jgi:D-alanyl-D-alanine carboxypeptidase/D-alanyl-D-alanine-endopeptidase (penicillin-binding protein 4)